MSGVPFLAQAGSRQTLAEGNLRRSTPTEASSGPGTGAHVAIVIGKNKIVSHGSEGGPYVLRPDYRADISQVRRYFG